jgi:4-diphosphocytidyl-2-C-methyl-D-erythritol kinase
VVPRKRVLTAKIYGLWDKRRTGLTRPRYAVKILNSALRKKDFALIGEALFNSLEAVTLAMYPQVKRVREKLKELGLKSILMSGSGSVVFGIVSSRKEAARLYRQLKGTLKEEGSFWRVFATRTC